MKLVLFVHSLASCWNHGNAHFLRGVVRELREAGHHVDVWEPANGWSRSHVDAATLADLELRFPSRTYRRDLDVAAAVDGADVALVHEWNDHDLVRRIGEHRARSGRYKLLFHDTHHRAVTAPEQMAAYDLRHYDGVLAFGAIIRDLYLRQGWTPRAWVWHEAADTRVFHPRPHDEAEGDVVWIGNWGDDERRAELHEFLIGPIRDLKLKARLYGVRYPEHAMQALFAADVAYGGWLPNYRVPEVFSRYRLTVHVPRRPYVKALQGIPTIRPFEALACAIPLITAPWNDSEGLFSAGRDYLVARDGDEMRRMMRDVLNDRALAQSLAMHGLTTIQNRHTCAHRVTELMSILEELGMSEELHLPRTAERQP